MRIVTLALALLLALVHVELWFGKGGVPRMIELQGKLEAQQATNEAARHRNAAARGRGQRPQGRPRDGRGEGPPRARHDQARRDLRPALDAEALNGSSGWLDAATPLFATRLRLPGRADHLARDPRLRAWRSRWSVCNIRVNVLGWPLAIASSLLYFLLFWNSRLYGDASLQTLLRRGRRLGLVAMAARHRRAGRALRVRTLGGQRPLDRACRARRSPGRRRASSSAASPTPTCPGGTRSRPRRACSASGCSAASTSRTGRSGSSSTSSPSALFAYKGLWLTVVLYVDLRGDVVARLAQPGGTSSRRQARRHEPRPSSSPCSAPRAPARPRSPARARPCARADGHRTSPSSARCLREFCDRDARTPRRDEQAAIAASRRARIAAAAAGAEVVVADTTALMIAVYSDLVFGDTSLYASRRGGAATLRPDAR